MKPKKIILYTDGGSRGNPGPAGAGIVIQDDSGKSLLEKDYFLGELTNNQAEYRALILGLQEAAKLEPAKLQVILDSELIVNQIKGDYRVKDRALQILFAEVTNLLGQFDKVDVKHTTRERNKQADKLVNRALDRNARR